MSTKLELPAGLRIWLLWVMMSALGGGIGFALGHRLARAMPDFVGRTGSDTVLYAVFGSLVSVAQWLVLRTRIAKAGWWVLVGFLVWTVLGVLGYRLQRTIPLVFCAALAGAVLGLFQSLVLRRHVRWSGFWVAASTLGWGLSWPVAGALDRAVGLVVTDEIAGFTVGFAILTAVSGVFTGLALVLLLGHSQPERLQRDECATQAPYHPIGRIKERSMNLGKTIRTILLGFASLFGVLILLWGFLWLQLLVRFPPEHVYLSATSPDGSEIAHFSVKYQGIHPWIPTDIEPHRYVTVVGTTHGEVLVRETEYHGTIKNTFAELAEKHAPWAVESILSLEWEASP